MKLRSSVAWIFAAVVALGLGMLIETEASGYIHCHRVVEQASPLLVPAWDPITFHCGVRL